MHELIISIDSSDCFNKKDITLESGKEYMVYIASWFASSYPIVQLFSKYNPIFIYPKAEINIQNKNIITITLNPECRTRIKNGETTFAKVVLESEFLAKLLTALKNHQGDVWVKTPKNNMEFKPLFNDHVKSLGLTPEQSFKWNNKIEQYHQFKDIVPIANFVITSKNEATTHFSALASSRGVITSLPRTGQGSGIRIHANEGELQKYLAQITEEHFLLITALHVKMATSIDVLIANKKEVIAYGLVKQTLDVFACLGGIYPADLSQKLRAECYKIANKVAVKLAEEGLRGIVSIDMLIDEDDYVYFCELNASYSGTTHNRMLALEQVIPQPEYSLIDLEVMALKEGTLKGHQIPAEPKNIFWSKTEIYSKRSGKVGYLHMANDALKVAKLGKGNVFVGRYQEGAFVEKGTSVGNLICTGKTEEEWNKLSRRGHTLIAQQYMPKGGEYVPEEKGAALHKQLPSIEQSTETRDDQYSRMSNCVRGDRTPSPAPFLIQPTQTSVSFPHQQQFFHGTSDRSPLKGQQNKRKKAMDSEIEEHSQKRQRILPSNNS